jgi:phosphoribosylaminoimidazolecarboxamide formyltransferase / IMP cyclohydrolase
LLKIQVKRAILSVFNKEGIVDLAKELVKMDVEILSTGGTYSSLTEAGVKCVKIEDFTGLKEFFGGRVKTLHPLIHGGILSKRDREAEDLGIKQIDLVVVNLYDFENLIAKGEKNIPELIEMIDIGGPTMLRSTAKNYKYACPVCSPEFYSSIIEELKNGGLTEETRYKMAIETLRVTSYYDAMISRVLNNISDFTDKNPFQKKITIPLKKDIDMRYGENPHQNASYYVIPDYKENSVSGFFTEGKLHGKELSFNNIGDVTAAIRILSELDDKSAVVIKHGNPCGAASRNNTYDSFMAAYEGDTTSIFGGIVAVKGDLDIKTADVLKDIFLEIVIARSFSKEAFEILSKKKNIRLLEYKNFEKNIFIDNNFPEVKKVLGGFLIQEKNTSNPYDEELKVITKAQPTKDQIEDLVFGQSICKHVKSNAIVVVKNKMLLGTGCGQMNRVGSAKIALDWAGDKAKGAVMASDAYFPMDDTVKLAAERGVTAIIQPGGSINDEKSIKACDELGLSMIFTGIRHFLH